MIEHFPGNFLATFICSFANIREYVNAKNPCKINEFSFGIILLITNGVQEAGSSNLLTQTKKKALFSLRKRGFFFILYFPDAVSSGNFSATFELNAFFICANPDATLRLFAISV